MEREYLQKILEEYANSRLDTVYSEDNFKDEEIIPSKRHQRRMKKIIWCERYFGTHIKLGYTVRRVAVAGAVVLSLAAANHVSAKVFGVNPWEMLVKSIDGAVEIQFAKPKKTGSIGRSSREFGERKRLVPAAIPAGYQCMEEHAVQGKNNWTIWQKGEKGITYTGTIIQPNTTVDLSAKYIRKERTVVAGYAAEYLVYENDITIVWNDFEYQNVIYATGLEKEELRRIAESLYEKDK